MLQKAFSAAILAVLVTIPECASSKIYQQTEESKAVFAIWDYVKSLGADGTDPASVEDLLSQSLFDSKTCYPMQQGTYCSALRLNIKGVNYGLRASDPRRENPSLTWSFEEVRVYISSVDDEVYAAKLQQNTGGDFWRTLVTAHPREFESLQEHGWLTVSDSDRYFSFLYTLPVTEEYSMFYGKLWSPYSSLSEHKAVRHRWASEYSRFTVVDYPQHPTVN